MTDPGPRPRVPCLWDLAFLAVTALGAGLGLGAWFHRELLGDPIPFFAVDDAQAVDGDTVRVTLIVHLDGMDAPELDRNRCVGERDKGLAARDRLAVLLAAGPARIKILGEDRLGRLGALFTAADRPVAPIMLREGHLQAAEAGRWCPNDAQAGPPVLARLASLLGGGP